MSRGPAFSAFEYWLLTAAAPRAFPMGSPSAPELDPGWLAKPETGRLASRNRVGGLLRSLVERPEIRSRLDPEARAEAQAALADSLLLGLKLEREILGVGELLGEAGVEALIYKGADIAERCYERTAPRLFGDLDLIVRRHQLADTVSALRRAEYALTPADGPPFSYYRRFHLHATLAHAKKLLPVEVHWALRSPYEETPDSIPDLFEGAERDGIFGPAILRPAPIDGFALMVMHAEKHLLLSAFLPTREARLKSVIESGGLIWVLDLVRWLERFGQPDAQVAIERRIEELGAERALPVASRLAADLDPEALPDWARAEAERLPRQPIPRIVRVLYPHWTRSEGARGVTDEGDEARRRRDSARHRRAFLSNPLPRLGFRPLLVLQALLPTPRLADAPDRTAEADRESGPRRIRRCLRWLALASAHLMAILRWRLFGKRLREHGSGPGGAQQS